MSTFTRFNANLATSYDRAASQLLRKDYWRVERPFRYYVGQVGSNTYVDVPAGKLSDGASVPFPVNALIPAWGEYGQCAVLHDTLCDSYCVTQVINGVPTQVAIDRKEIDRILLESMLILGVERWRVHAIMFGVDAYRITTRPKAPKIIPGKLELERSWSGIIA